MAIFTFQFEISGSEPMKKIWKSKNWWVTTSNEPVALRCDNWKNRGVCAAIYRPCSKMRIYQHKTCMHRLNGSPSMASSVLPGGLPACETGAYNKHFEHNMHDKIQGIHWAVACQTRDWTQAPRLPQAFCKLRHIFPETNHIKLLLISECRNNKLQIRVLSQMQQRAETSTSHFHGPMREISRQAAPARRDCLLDIRFLTRNCKITKWDTMNPCLKRFACQSWNILRGRCEMHGLHHFIFPFQLVIVVHQVPLLLQGLHAYWSGHVSQTTYPFTLLAEIAVSRDVWSPWVMRSLS